MRSTPGSSTSPTSGRRQGDLLVQIPAGQNVTTTYPIARVTAAPNPAGAAAFVSYVRSPCPPRASCAPTDSPSPGDLPTHRDATLVPAGAGALAVAFLVIPLIGLLLAGALGLASPRS